MVTTKSSICVSTLRTNVPKPRHDRVTSLAPKYDTLLYHIVCYVEPPSTHIT